MIYAMIYALNHRGFCHTVYTGLAVPLICLGVLVIAGMVKQDFFITIVDF